ncbi:MAG: ABC transporter substrate-binding protein [Pseudomonadota bacterium]
MKYSALILASLFYAVTSDVIAQSLTITDQNDREVTLEGPAERVVTIPIPAASMFIALDGGTEHLAGMHPRSKTAVMEGVLGTFFPQSKEIPSDVVGEGFMPNVEALLALDPDLVFQWAHRGDDIIDPLLNAGLNVLTFRYGTDELARGWIEMMGTVVGNPEKSKRLIGWREEVLAEIEAQSAGLDDTEKPRTMYFLRFLEDLRVAGDDVFQNVSIGIAGGQNPAADGAGWRSVNREQILAWDPEIILLNGFETELTPGHVYADPVLQDVSAVRNRRIYKMPLGGYRWDPPNQESPLSWMWLAMVLHPERFDFPLRQAIAENYQWIYGQTPTSAQIDDILRLEIHDDAAGYDRFKG